MALSDRRRRISSSFPTIKVEDSFHEIFKDRKLLNLVIAYLSATDSALDLYDCTETFLRKAKDDERTVEETLGRFDEDSSVSTLEGALNFESCFSDKSFIEDFIQKLNNFRKQISNLERLIERLMDSSSFSIGEQAEHNHPKRINALQRRCEMLREVDGDALVFRYCSKMVVERIHRMSVRIDIGNMEMLEGKLKFLEGEHKLLTIKIEDLEQWMGTFLQVVEARRCAVFDKILGFLIDCVSLPERQWVN